MYPFDTLTADEVNTARHSRVRNMTVVLAVIVGLAALQYLLTRPVAPELGVVSGVVTLNGRPVEDAMVEFLPDPEQGTLGFTAAAATDKDGRYRARIDRYEKDGAVIGRHRVIVWTDPGPAPTGATGVRLPPEYGDAFTTPLRPVEVKPGEQVYDIAITTTTKPKS